MIGDVVLRRAVLLLVVASCVAAATAPSTGATSKLANRTFRLGSVYVIKGHTGTWAASKEHMLGLVTLHGSWQGRPWVLVAKTEAERPNGSYRFVVRPRRRGVLHLRVGTPDGGRYKVVLTVV